MSNLVDKIYRKAYIDGMPNLAEYIRLAIADPEVKTAATDGVDIFYAPAFISSLTVDEAVGVFMHEYYHIIYEHCPRGQGRHPEIWNLAIDVVVNDAVIHRCGLQLPHKVIRRGEGLFKDLPDELTTSVKIYEWLMSQGALQPSSEEKVEAGNHIWDSNKETSQAKARKQASQMSDKSEEMRDVLAVGNDIDWIDLVKAVQIESGRLVHRTHKRSYNRPARYEPSGIIRPCSRRYQHHPKIDVYIDVSGSMGDNPVAIFKGLKTILGALRIYQPKFYTFNTEIAAIDIKSDKFKIGGGTSIKNVLQKIETDKADLAVLITDCEDNIQPDDFKDNVIIVSNNTLYADYITADWQKVKKTNA